MNKDILKNKCDMPQEQYDDDNLIAIKYTEGSIVNAQIAGYP